MKTWSAFNSDNFQVATQHKTKMGLSSKALIKIYYILISEDPLDFITTSPSYSYLFVVFQPMIKALLLDT